MPHITHSIHWFIILFPILQGPFEDYSPNFWTSLYHILGHVITVISIESIDYTTNIYIYIIFIYIYIDMYIFQHIFQLLNLMVFCNVEDPRSNFLDAPRFLQEHPLSSLSELNSLRSQNGPVKFRHPSGMWNSMSPGWWFGTGFFFDFPYIGNSNPNWLWNHQPVPIIPIWLIQIPTG